MSKIVLKNNAYCFKFNSKMMIIYQLFKIKNFKFQFPELTEKTKKIVLDLFEEFVFKLLVWYEKHIRESYNSNERVRINRDQIRIELKETDLNCLMILILKTALSMRTLSTMHKKTGVNRLYSYLQHTEVNV